MDFIYPFAYEGKMKLKFTVSELKKYAALVEEPGEEMYAEPEVVPLIPAFLKEEEALTGASRGSAYHKLMELLDFRKEYDADILSQTVDELRREGKLTDEMARCIRTEDIIRFFFTVKAASGWGERPKVEKLYKEQPFVLSMDASVIYPEYDTDEKILVQGIIDVYFEEPDGLVVLDYKTDRVKTAQELKEKYHAQLDYYAQALERLTETTGEGKDYLFLYASGGNQGMMMDIFEYYLIGINC